MPDLPVYSKSVFMRFYSELNDFLKKNLKQKNFEYTFKGQITVKDAIESLGVPHSAVDLVLVNGNSVEFGHRLKQGDQISVYPVFETFDISEISMSGRKPLRETRFIADAHLGKLARDLRMLGFDSLFAKEISDYEIIIKAGIESRIILTRDRDLLKSALVDHGYYVRSLQTREQLIEVIDKFDLWSQFDPFSRCLVCNHELSEVSLSAVVDIVKPDTLSIYRKFYRCCGCERIYWEGSHYNRMMEYINSLKKNDSGDTGNAAPK
jgi:uncharacterized protein